MLAQTCKWPPKPAAMGYVCGVMRALPAILLTCLVACRQNDDPMGAEDLLEQVQADDYRSWQRAPGYEERRPSDAPHSDNVDIFVNDVVAARPAPPSGRSARSSSRTATPTTASSPSSP